MDSSIRKWFQIKCCITCQIQFYNRHHFKPLVMVFVLLVFRCTDNFHIPVVCCNNALLCWGLNSFINWEGKKNISFKSQRRMEVLLQRTLLITSVESFCSTNCAIDCHFILLKVYI